MPLKKWMNRSCGCGGTGRRAWFRSMFSQGSGGSSPLIRTKTSSAAKADQRRGDSGHVLPQAAAANKSQEKQQSEFRLVTHHAEHNVSIHWTTGNHDVPVQPIMVPWQPPLKMLFG